MNDMRQKLIEIVTVLQAVEVLEYHNKNLLINQKSISEQKQGMLSQALEILDRFELDPKHDA